MAVSVSATIWFFPLCFIWEFSPLFRRIVTVISQHCAFLCHFSVRLVAILHWSVTFFFVGEKLDSLFCFVW